jgi:hypothetical protein
MWANFIKKMRKWTDAITEVMPVVDEIPPYGRGQIAKASRDLARQAYRLLDALDPEWRERALRDARAHVRRLEDEQTRRRND